MSSGQSKPGLDTRVELQLHDRATPRQHRELGAFVRYCVARIERAVGRADGWTVKVVPTPGGYVCDVIVQAARTVVQETRTRADATLAAWEALCKVEQLILEDCAHRANARAEHATTSPG